VTLNIPAAGAPRRSPASATLAVRPARVARVVIDARDGTVVAGGDLAVGEAVVSHGAVTLNIGADARAGRGAPNAGGAAGQGVPATCASPRAPAPEGRRRPCTPCRRRPPTSPPSSPPCANVGALSADVIVR
jgi:flagellar P-ring protein precursor FlgI